MRDHEAVVIEEFNGLWARGGADSTPLDHFSDCNNIQFIQSGFKTRDGLNTYLPYPDVRRTYTYISQTVEGLLVLDSNGNIYHSASPTPFSPILHVDGMTDFGFVGIAGRAYITPCNSITGLPGEFLYVYKGDGSAARKAAGDPPATPLTIGLSGNPGNVEAGVHIYSVVYETDTGFLTALAPPTEFANSASVEIRATNIPVSPDPAVIARRLVATISIDPASYTGDVNGYQFFFVPGLRIPDNTTTQADMSFFDADLVDDASHLIDNFSEIPAGVGLNVYHNRLISWASAADISVAQVSFQGEPEAISQVSGLIIAPLDAQPLTNAQEYRDVLYLFKQTHTLAYTDSGDVPSSWPLVVIDQGIGASVHGVCTILDTGGVNIEYLIIADYSGIMLFNGAYQRPELSWKIKDFWFELNRSAFLNIQIMNDSINQILYTILPNKQMLIGDYSNGMDPKNIRWCPWTLSVNTSSIALVNTNDVIIGAHSAS
jgi:hypothetical protein